MFKKSPEKMLKYIEKKAEPISAIKDITENEITKLSLEDFYNKKGKIFSLEGNYYKSKPDGLFLYVPGSTKEEIPANMKIINGNVNKTEEKPTISLETSQNTQNKQDQSNSPQEMIGLLDRVKKLESWTFKLKDYVDYKLAEKDKQSTEQMTGPLNQEDLKEIKEYIDNKIAELKESNEETVFIIRDYIDNKIKVIKNKKKK